VLCCAVSCCVAATDRAADYLITTEVAALQSASKLIQCALVDLILNQCHFLCFVVPHCAFDSVLHPRKAGAPLATCFFSILSFLITFIVSCVLVHSNGCRDGLTLGEFGCCCGCGRAALATSGECDFDGNGGGG
jgi:hypothetical protein